MSTLPSIATCVLLLMFVLVSPIRCQCCETKLEVFEPYYGVVVTKNQGLVEILTN
jgi:predicted cation transporter